MSTIVTSEIFGPTIQGEGPNTGARCIFVRVKGCSFRCSWCDSKHTWFDSTEPAREWDSAELGDYLHRWTDETNCKHVVLTGGNPCLFDFTSVIRHNPDVRFDVETQGDLTPRWLADVNTVVFSPKAPSSGMPDTFGPITSYLTEDFPFFQRVAIKIPVFSDEDIEFARNYAAWINRFNETDPEHFYPVRLYLSVGNTDTESTEAVRDRVLSDYDKLIQKINETPAEFEHVYILPQVHTLVWGNRRGV